MMRATWHVILVHLTFDVLHASLRLVNVYKNVSCIYDFKHLIWAINYKKYFKTLVLSDAVYNTYMYMNMFMYMYMFFY